MKDLEPYQRAAATVLFGIGFAAFFVAILLFFAFPVHWALLIGGVILMLGSLT